MVLRSARDRCGNLGQALLSLPGAAVVGAALIAGLAGCSAIETWRSVSGIARNDPDPATAPFTGNLAAGETAPYPNLATVPPPPTRATTTAERQKLTQTLVTERTETQSDAAKLPPVAAAPSAAVPTSSAATPQPVASPAGTATPAETASAAPGAPAQPSSSADRRKGTEPPALESSLEMPQVAVVPEPEKPRPPPATPHLAPPPAVPPASAGPPPEALATATPRPAPPVPVMAAVPPPPTLPKPEAKAVPGATLAASLELPGTPLRLDDTAAAEIQRVATRYKEQPGRVRVVAYATAAPSGGDPLSSYRVARERAQAVAAALSAAGIPADKVQAEAAPAGAGISPDRIEIQFAP